jgi:hypothetical protein
MKTNKNKEQFLKDMKDNPFRVPEDYFNNLEKRIMEKVRQEEVADPEPVKKKIHLRPFLALAASISGLALIIYLVLQSIVGSRFQNDTSFDLALLDETGIIQDELILVETYSMDEESSLSEWDEDAMTYLASNEVDLLLMLESN